MVTRKRKKTGSKALRGQKALVRFLKHQKAGIVMERPGDSPLLVRVGDEGREESVVLTL